MSRPFWTALLAGTQPAIGLDAWLSDKRDEAQRLHRDNYRHWLRNGAQPAPIYGKADT